MTPEELRRRARVKLRAINRQRASERYQRCLGRFVKAGLLVANAEVELNADKLHVADVLWAGQVEPRFLEVLPALLVRRPAFFHKTKTLPQDLAVAVAALRRGKEPAPFRGIPGAALLRQLSIVAPRRRLPARVKSFRLGEEDCKLLSALAEQLQVSETEVIRRGLLALA